MPRLDHATRNIVIGSLQTGKSQNEVARTLNVNQSTISRLWNIFQQTGSSNDHPSSGRPHIKTPKQDRHILVFHLRYRTVSASTTAVGIHGLRTISSQTVRTGFGSMALYTEGHISERYWRRYTDVKESVGTTY